MHTKQVILLFLTIFLINSCDTNEPPPPPDGEKPTLELKLEDASCTEAWIELTTTNLQLPATIELKQFNPTGDTLSQILYLNTQDSVLYIDSLMPQQTYQYKASSIEYQISSNELSVITMDTTSHDFTFETFTFGGTAGSSTLYDVAIIDENNIWAVGEIYVADTSQNGYTMYNVVHWDGNQWELKRIPYYDYGGYLVYGPLQTVFAFAENDVWFCSYANLLQYNGSDFISRAFFMTNINFDGQVIKMWGYDDDNIYCVGRNGAIYHYHGNGWTQIESGTDISLGDIFSNDSNDIFISGADNVNVRGIILKNSGTNSFNTLITSEVISENELFDKLYGSLSSVWVDEKNTVYTGGNILFRYKFNQWDYVRSMPENYIGGNPNVYYRGFIHSIRGNSSIDYWVVGDRNTVRHFNGISWKQIGYPYDPGSFRIWRSVSVKDNLCVIVGNNSGAASVMIIRR